MTFAEKLRKARKDAGMSQEMLADKLGVSRQAVTKRETDRGIPDIENIMTISNLFGISVDEFLSEEKDAVSKKGYLSEPSMICTARCSGMRNLMPRSHLRMILTGFEKCIAFVSTFAYTTIEKVFRKPSSNSGDDVIWQRQQIYMQGLNRM